MKQTTQSYKDIFANPNHWAEHQVTINGVTYGMDAIVKLSTPGQLFDTSGPGIGSAVSREMELEFMPRGTIPAAAKCVVKTRIGAIDEATGFEQWSTWIPMGEFYIDSRAYDETGEVMKVHCYDAMLKTEYVYLDKHMDSDSGASWPKRAREVYQNISADIGVTGSADVIQAIPASWVMPYPGNKTARDLLREIAVALGGNFVVNDSGLLACVRLKKSTTVAQDLKLNVGALERGVDSGAFTKVRITGIQGVEGVTEYTAGNDTGLTIEGECPWGTQAIADSVLSTIAGWVYRPYTASEALLDPAVEIGDTVKINGWTSMVAKLDRNFDKMCDATLSAPEDEELNHEYPYVYTGYKGNHELKKVEQEVNKVDAEVAGLKSDLGETNKSLSETNKNLEAFKGSIGSMSSQRTTALNFSKWSSKEFTETLEGGTVMTYTLTFDSSGRPTKVTASDGHAIGITW
ncbi:hypothetical protein [Bittarella massiliensis (ex Durand et al. 2017)]|uniref:hypothetical protein n=1 Tax=Bittarella massiliensis (ex Durand et al. 2017) TaxID=1720313 RepID=UPI001AA13D70|nr:hypothetical protein [Bittarella massiliensis (ex Durand et al. 2017)]MBO1680183.1 hypothetical protein [Bittarella massiliensis (ex Durand et al. 2017)]